jgi:hypothetical protein
MSQNFPYNCPLIIALVSFAFWNRSKSRRSSHISPRPLFKWIFYKADGDNVTSKNDFMACSSQENNSTKKKKEWLACEVEMLKTDKHYIIYNHISLWAMGREETLSCPTSA